MGKEKIPHDIRQNEINYICTLLNHHRISTTQDLTTNFLLLIEQIRKNPEIFKQIYTLDECFAILKKSLAVYNHVYAFNITLKKDLITSLEKALKKTVAVHSIVLSTEDDLSKITRGYDRLEIALEKEKKINKRILQKLRDTEIVVIPQIIIGSGDTGTTLWLEKFQSHHGTCQKQLSDNQLPPVLMIGKDAGSWKHNYTLAQPHSLLERTTAKENPSAYLVTEHYQKNPHINGRHVYQANQACLGLTEAPLLRASVMKIEKKSNHEADWKAPEQEYRIVVSTADGIKYIYTNEVNICTGLGPARNIISGKLLPPTQFELLNQFDSQKGFTTIVDGNQFILTGTEEQKTNPRKIVVYGGGGTAAASYRKGFFGHDAFTENLEFSEKNQKNSVIWIAKQFEKAGNGRLASSALSIAKSRSELMQGELIKIEPQVSGKLLLTFRCDTSGKKIEIPIECDQLIYSIGQDDSHMRRICQEAETDLSLVFDANGMLLNVCSADKKVIFFGAAAMAVREREYMTATWSWLKSENIGGDVGPGTMAPSRAQIKCYNFWNGIHPTSINANIDSHFLIMQFLEKAGIEKSSVALFVADLLEARKSSTCGASRSLILSLLKKHKLDHRIEIKGHVHLSLIKESMPQPSLPKHQLLSWLGKEKSEDADAFISSTMADIGGSLESIGGMEESSIQLTSQGLTQKTLVLT
ncbi:Uncharacterised protein [Legionella wadsworthii]|uniref:Uncharacterized protein n=1 Tax=Legionella wadsworthii TaxID=28088 RepID=A0A378LR98_9GAMM|nr:hypothetical protein [Legionella wadsworthii]STY29284.1 Uncharacterised protein [Legionella wadsworthii]